jgi:hypothetical protein
MKHYVMTRASYGPEWTDAANRARLRITAGVTARTLRLQRGVGEWAWIVLVDGRDPLLAERLRVFGDATPELLPIIWEPADDLTHAPWDRKPIGTRSAAVAAAAYRHPAWLQYTPRDEAVLQTRLDDDDGLARDYFRRVRAATAGLTERTALMFPVGVRVWDGREAAVRHDTNAMHSLWTPAGDETTIYSYGHRLVEKGQPVVTVDQQPGWLWVRHANTLSGWKKADRPLSARTKRLFPIDWGVL